MMKSTIRSEYTALRHAQQKRIARAERAGFATDYQAPPLRGMSEREVKREFAKLKRWMSSPENTLQGRRIESSVSADIEEQRRKRKNERERQRYQRKREAEGKPYTPRVQRTEEERKERERARKRAYRERKREEKRRAEARRREEEEEEERLQAIRRGLLGETAEARNALENLLSGLTKYGIKVPDLETLKKWGEYIAERARDSDKDFYFFDVWLDELAQYSDKTNEDLTGADVERLLDDFHTWSGDRDELEREMLRERQPNEYSAADLGSMFSSFINVKRGGFSF